MPDRVDSLALLRQHLRNLIVLRTFSKAYGMAGMRCGYALAHADMAAGLRAIATPFGVNALAQVAAQAALGSQQLVNQQVDSLLGERDRVASALAAQGWNVPESIELLVVRVRDLSKRFEELCAEAGITVRRFGNEGVRVTIAEREGSVRPHAGA